MSEYVGLCIGGPRAGQRATAAMPSFACVEQTPLLELLEILRSDIAVEAKRSWYQWVELHRGRGVFAHESVYCGDDPMGMLTVHILTHYKPEASNHG